MSRVIKYELLKNVYTKWLMKITIISLGLSGFRQIGYFLSNQNWGFTDASSFSGAKFLLVTYDNSSIGWILAVMIPVYICSSFINGTIKNELVGNVKREVLFCGKYAISILISTALFFINTVFSFILGCIFGGPGERVGHVIYNSFLQCLLLISLVTIYFFVSLCVKNQLVAVLTNLFIVLFLGQIFIIIERFVFKGKIEIAKICPTVLIQQLMESYQEWNISVAYCYISAFVLTVLFASLSFVVSKKYELL